MSNQSSVGAFRDEIQRKIRNLLREFGEGKLSTEQFNILYERYNNQYLLASSVIDGEKIAGGEMSTIAIREATTGRALGLALYHHRSGTMLETLGNFDVPVALITPVLNAFSEKLEQRIFVDPVVRQIDAQRGHWVIFMARLYTTAITIFQHEPAKLQLRELERLLHDFEEANRRLLEANDVNPRQLARPFIGFVKRKLKD